MKTLRLELRRAFLNKNMLISLMLGIYVACSDLLLFCKDYMGDDKVLVQAWIGTNYLYAYNNIYYILFPIIACLPFGGSLYTDTNSGYDKNICIKVSRIDYICSKCISVFLSGALAVTVPVLLNLFVAAGFFPNMQAERLEWLVAGAIIDRNLFSDVYAYNAVVYCLIFIVIDAFWGGVIALLSIAITKLSGSFFTVIVVPFVLFILQGMLMIGDCYGNWAILWMINPQQLVNTRWYQMIVMYFFVLLLSLGVSIIINRKRDVL